MCMLVYPMGIQIYDQVSIPRSWSKAKLHHAVLLGFGLNTLKIALNIMKVGVHFHLSNPHPNLGSNFDSEELVRSETLSCIFAGVGLKGSPNSLELCKSCHARLFIKRASKSMIKFQFQEFG